MTDEQKIAAEQAAADKAAAAEKVAADKAAAAAEKAAKPTKKPFAEVFEGNPSATEIFVVDGMPFLELHHAMNHAKGDKTKVQAVKKG